MTRITNLGASTPSPEGGKSLRIPVERTHTAATYLVNVIIRPALVYFAIVMGAGFLLGVVRVPFLVPRLGERWAELAEMPIMGVVIYLAAGYVLRRYPSVRSPGRALATGAIALALSVFAELGLAMALQSQTLADFIASRDKVSGSVYVALLLVFGIMPRIRLRNQDAAPNANSEV